MNVYSADDISDPFPARILVFLFSFFTDAIVFFIIFLVRTARILFHIFSASISDFIYSLVYICSVHCYTYIFENVLMYVFLSGSLILRVSWMVNAHMHSYKSRPSNIYRYKKLWKIMSYDRSEETYTIVRMFFYPWEYIYLPLYFHHVYVLWYLKMRLSTCRLLKLCLGTMKYNITLFLLFLVT